MYGMEKIALITLAGLLSGCSTLMEQLDNRAACTVGGDQAYVLSMYGPIGIASKISEKDRAAICSNPQGVSQ